IEERKFAHHFVLIGRDLFAKNAEGRIAIAAPLIAEHLIVGAVLLDNINDMLEEARFANSLRDGPRRLAGPRGQFDQSDSLVAEIAPYNFRELGGALILLPRGGGW